MKKMEQFFDVVVVGGGHAACEAALASARFGASTLMLTINMDHIGQMSCNPAIGGIGKGQVTREIDALGGAQGRVSDASSIQFRMLNRTKGPAVWSPRAQCDKVCFQRSMKRELEMQDNLEIKQAMVTDFIIEKNKITGVRTEFSDRFLCRSLVLATGTFLSGKLHYGLYSVPGGRAGDPPSSELAVALKKQLDLRIGRLKTGTPPRILAKSIDFNKMERQDTELCDEKFSFFSSDETLPRASRRDLPCFMLNSTPESAEIVRKNIHKSPLYQGVIEGIGARYCPSFEDKIMRFPHHEKHLLFLEPEGEFTEEYYLNGFSSSLPPEVQIQMLRSVTGMEKAEIARYAYAIEYDFVFPDQLDRSLRVKRHLNLFLAGQINGSSGYEEAAGQGLIAGLNAAKVAANEETVFLGRDDGYVGVMIDDLVTKDIIEPYRLFTSRAEYRLRLRQDNADLRLCQFAYDNGILPADKFKVFEDHRDLVDQTVALARNEKLEGKTVWELMRSCHGKVPEKLPFQPELLKLNTDTLESQRALRQVLIQAHYEGYLKRENESVKQLHRLEHWQIPSGFDYVAIKGLRNESRMKLSKIAPATLAQAGRIDGVTPAEIGLLQVHLKRLGQTTAPPKKLSQSLPDSKAGVTNYC